MENFFNEIINSIINYFLIIGLLIFKHKKSSIFIFSDRFHKTQKVKINGHVIFLFTILYIFVLKAIIYYLFTDNLEKSYISDLLSYKYFNSDAIFRLLVALVPFIVFIYGICFAFISNRRKRECWINFFLMNFSAQLFCAFTISSPFALFLTDENSFFSKLIIIIVMIIIILFILKSFEILHYAETFNFIRKDDYGYGVLFSIVLPVVFVYCFSFSKQNDKVEYQFSFQNERNEKIALVNIDSINVDSFKFSIKCHFILESKVPIVIGASSKKLAFRVTWPLLGKYKTKDADTEGLRLSIESSEELIYLEYNKPHPITFVTYLTKRQLDNLLIVSSTPKDNNLKIACKISKPDAEIINYYNDSFDIRKNY